MKKLKYLLIAILFAAFAGEGFGQTLSVSSNGTTSSYTYNPGTGNVTGTKYTYANCSNDFEFTINMSYIYFANCRPGNDYYVPNNTAYYYQYRPVNTYIILQRLISTGWTNEQVINDPSTVVQGNPFTVYSEVTSASHSFTETISQNEVHYRIIIGKELHKYDVNAGLDANGNPAYTESYEGSSQECEIVEYFKLKHVKTPLSVTSILTDNGNIHQPNGYGAEFDVCGPFIYLDNLTPTCYDQWIVYMKEKTIGGTWTTYINCGVKDYPLPPSINLTNMFGLTPDKRYRIELKVAKNGQWSSSTANMYTFDFKETFTPTISAQSPICNGDNVTLQIQNYSNNPSGISWSSGQINVDQITVNPNMTTVYVASFTEACTQTPVTKTIIVNPIPVIDFSNLDPNYCLNVPGVPTTPVTFNPLPVGGVWSPSSIINSSNQFNPSSHTLPGTFIANYSVTDANGCTADDDFTFGYYGSAIISGTVDNVTCLGSLDGAIYPVATGQPSFVYSFNGNTQAPPYTSLTGGSYNVEVIDGRGCISNQNFVVTEATTALSTGSPSISDETCKFSNNGQITITPTGGITPYTINWSNGATGTTNTGMAPGTYSVTVTDANGCEDITTGMQINAATTGIVLGTPGTTINSSCVGVCDGSSSIGTVIFGSSPNYTYAWSDGITGTNPNGAFVTHANMCSGNYSVTVTDASGCTSSATVSITDGPSNWHKNTQNITYNDDDEIKRVLTDANGDVYVLGEFTGTTELDGSSFSSGSQSPVGIFLAKYSNCGNLRWYVYSNMGGYTSNIKAVDIDFDNSGNIVLFAQVLSGQPSFDLIDQNNPPVQVIGTNPFFYAPVNTLSGDLGTVSNVQSSIISLSDKVNSAKINGSDYYFAGQFSNEAGVIKNNTSVFTENSTGNEIVDMEILGNTLYAIANISSLTSFGSVSVPNNGGQEGVIMEYDLSTSSFGSIIPAQGNDVTLKDLALDINDDVWVVGQFSDAIQGWSTLAASQKTALIMQFDASLSPLSSYYSNPQASNQSISSADAIGSFTTSGSTVNAIYIAGTFNGNDMNLDGTSGTVQTTGGSGTSNDLWLSQFNLGASSGVSTAHWVHASSSLEDVTVNALAFDNINAFVVGSYKADINLPPNMVLQHMAQGTAFGYIIRGGDIFGAPSYYKTGGSAANETKNKDIPTGLLESTRLNLYPNPNNGMFTIDYRSEVTGIVLISVYDITGRQLMQQQVTKESAVFTHALALTQFTKGVYVLRLEIDGNSLYQKFIVE